MKAKTKTAVIWLVFACLLFLVVWYQAEYAEPVTSGEGQAPLLAHLFVTESIVTPLNTYRKDTGSYPTTAQGLMALLVVPPGVNNWHGPYITTRDVPRDPWGNLYQYACPGVHNPDGYDLWSLGDGRPGDSALIGNW